MCPTIKQKQAVERIVENHGNISKSMREVGYEENTCKNPKNLTESKGFKELCDECGLTDQFILDCLTEDIKNKPSYRATELQLGAKIKGMLSDKLDITGNGITITFDSAFKPKNEATEGSTSDKPSKVK